MSDFGLDSSHALRVRLNNTAGVDQDESFSIITLAVNTI